MSKNIGLSAIPSLDGWQLDIRANYGGSDRKTGMIGPDGSRYMIKFSEKKAPPNDLSTSYVNNVVSEHISSRIFATIGYPVHETALGTLDGEIVVTCRNFIESGEELKEFERYMRARYDSGDIGRVPRVEQVYEVIESDPVLSTQVRKLIGTYWERFIGDALVGNFDRHKGNFGYIIGKDNSVRPSPIYDNGSSLFPNLSEDGMQTVLSDPREIMKRVLLFPKAALELNGGKVDYYDIIASGFYEELTDATVSTVPRIKTAMPAVYELINGYSYLSDTRKEFYATMLKCRMGLILEPAYEICVSGQFDEAARARLTSGRGYTEADFETDWERLRDSLATDDSRRCATSIRERDVETVSYAESEISYEEILRSKMRDSKTK